MACCCPTSCYGGPGDERNTQDLQPGCIVLIAGFDDIPEHQFQVDEVYEELVTGTVLTGPLAGEYGEPEIELVTAVIPQETSNDS